jgi:regulator of RNase E activity RraB
MSRKKANKKVIELLKVFGADLRKKREVTHWFYFKEREDLERFEIYAFEIGFQTMQKELRKRKERDELLLIIYRIEDINIDSIDFDTSEFFQLAEKFNGIYDGWETSMEI